MNYYERHIGDYIKKTAHLSLLEHGIYTRLLDVYYDREAPLPEDKVARLIGARTEPETQALQVVLQEFFELQDGAWINRRCDEEIASYAEGEPEREVKKANEGNRLKRHRQERAALFKVLTDRGEHAPWNIGMEELRARVAALQVSGAETTPEMPPATAPATPATATQTPLPSTQSSLIPEPNGSVGKPDALPSCPTQSVIDLYHEVLPELPRVRLLSDKRRRDIGQRWRWVLTSKKADQTRRAETAEQALGWFRDYFGRARENDFLMGRGQRSGEHANWQCDIDFLLSERGMKHVIEKTRGGA